jgi:hypothetical protein
VPADVDVVVPVDVVGAAAARRHPQQRAHLPAAPATAAAGIPASAASRPILPALIAPSSSE